MGSGFTLRGWHSSGVSASSLRSCSSGFTGSQRREADIGTKIGAGESLEQFGSTSLGNAGSAIDDCGQCHR